jgi:hypothetical protein
MSNPISVIGGIAGSLIGGSSSRSAANAQAGAADRASDMQYRMFQEQAEMQKPWREAGENALAQMMAGVQPGGRYMSDFGMDDFQQDPGYGFRLSEGLKALDRQAAARGGLISGAALKAAGRYGQDMASQEYQNAFNRFQMQRGNQFNRLAGIAGTGQTSVGELGRAGQQTGAMIGGNMMQAGNARASGYMGVGNAVAGGINQLANQYSWSRMFPQGGGGQNAYTGSYGDFSSGGWL